MKHIQGGLQFFLTRHKIFYSKLPAGKVNIFAQVDFQPHKELVLNMRDKNYSLTLETSLVHEIFFNTHSLELVILI